MAYHSRRSVGQLLREISEAAGYDLKRLAEAIHRRLSRDVKEDLIPKSAMSRRMLGHVPWRFHEALAALDACDVKVLLVDGRTGDPLPDHLQINPEVLELNDPDIARLTREIGKVVAERLEQRRRFKTNKKLNTLRAGRSLRAQDGSSG